MIVDFRYHLTSLVAVFLALGLGIIIGTTLNSDGKLVNEQAALLDAIEAQLVQLKSEKGELEQVSLQSLAEVAFYKQFAEAILPELIAEELSGISVAVFALPPQAADPVIATMKMAGAAVTVETDPAKLTPGQVGVAIVAGQSGALEQGRHLVAQLRQTGIPVIVTGAGDWAQTLAAQGALRVLRVETAVGQLQLVQQVAALMQRSKN